MELGDVMGMQQGVAVTAPSLRESDLGLLKRAGLTQAAAAAASYPSPFLDEQKMLRFSKAAHALPSGLDASSATANTAFPLVHSFLDMLLDMLSANHGREKNYCHFFFCCNVQKKSKSQKENRGAAFMELDELS